MSKGRHAARKQRSAGRVVLAAIVAVAFVLGAITLILRAGTTSARAHVRHATASHVSPAASSPAQTAPAAPKHSESPGPWMVFAASGNVRLTLPVRDPEAVAYHQAYYDDAQPLRPIGHLAQNHYKSAFSPPPEQPGPDYLIEAPRGRGTGPTTAVDIMAPAGTAVYSPVDGTVVQVKRYKLYGQYPDMIVRIKPDADPHAEVVMIHLTNVQVRKGDEVRATLSVIGQPRVFPFHSEVNDYVRGGDPHVHIEVKAGNSTDHAPAT